MASQLAYIAGYHTGRAMTDRSSAAPLVSVIIPTYNRADLVKQSVDSVLRQTVSDYEVIVIDDGSTDDTRQVLESVTPPVRYLFQENRGFAAARNRGIAESRGEYLAFLDSDDLFEPRFLEAVLATFETHPEAGAVCSAEREIDIESNPGRHVYTKRSPGLFFNTAGLITTDTFVGCGRPAVVRRHWVEKLGGFDEDLTVAVDVEMWIRYSFDVPMVYQPEPLILYRVHASHQCGDKKTDAGDWLRVLDRLEREKPDFVRRHRRSFRRGRGKQYLRYGRELLVRHGAQKERLPEIRKTLRGAIADQPFLLRAWLYLAWSYLAPASYGRFRRWELQRK